MDENRRMPKTRDKGELSKLGTTLNWDEHQERKNEEENKEQLKEEQEEGNEGK